ncbi:MAG TPA: hypothetical protein VLB29_17070 [Nocardioidaceae bacterium]|nr:hypothetical protein [Nocardioidaceae bacterium]
MAAVLVLLLVVAVAAGVWGFTKLRSAEATLDDRADVVRVAEQFAVSVNNYDASSIDDYKSSVGELLSTKFSAEFDKAMQDIVAQVQEAQMESNGEVLASGVATIDNDSARVLVVADAAVKTVFDDRDRHFRWEVSLVKVDGEWLVDDFTPVA